MFVLTTEQITKAENSNSAAFSFFFFPAPLKMLAHNKEPRRSWELRARWRKKQAAAGDQNELLEDQTMQKQTTIQTQSGMRATCILFVCAQHVTACHMGEGPVAMKTPTLAEKCCGNNVNETNTDPK